MAFINSLFISQPTGFWPSIIFAFGAVGNYAWGIVLLTICIKLLMSPLDFFNKKVSRKNASMQAVLKPQMEKIQKQYGKDKNLYNQKLNELYKKNNYNLMGSCIFMLVNMVLTFVIFITLFSSLNGIANYKIQDQYYQLKDTYNQTILTSEAVEDEEKLAQANEAVIFKYNEIKDSWLWIDNVWQSETPWTNSIPTFEQYLKMVGNKVDIDKVNEDGTIELDSNGKPVQVTALYGNLTEDQQTRIKDEYNTVMSPLKENQSRTNGYLILTILAIGTAFLTQFLAQHRVGKKNKDSGQVQQKSNKILMIIMPLILGIFTLFYNSVFALYIVVGQIISLMLTPLIDFFLTKLEEKQAKKNEVVVEYSRKK